MSLLYITIRPYSAGWMTSFKCTSVQSFGAADCDSDHYLVVAKVREMLAVNKQRLHTFYMGRFKPKKVNDVQGKEKS
jgi:hypothetical protein